MGVQDENIDVFTVLAAFNRRRAGVAGRRANNDHALCALFKHVVEQAAEQLQGEIFERQGRAVEQLHDPFVAIELTQGCNRSVSKHAVGVFQYFFEVGIRDAACHKRTHHSECQLVIRQTSPRSDFFLRETWQVFWHVQTAIAGQTGQQHVFKIQGRCLAAGTDIAH